MKKFSGLIISNLFLFSFSTGCISESPLMTIEDSSIVSAQSTKKITFSMDKKDTTEVKKSSIIVFLDQKNVSYDGKGNIITNSKVKKQTVAIKDKKETGKEKVPSKVNIQFEKPTLKNDLSPQDYSNMAKIALQAMNSNNISYAESYKIGLNTLDDMSVKGLFVARVGWSAANATQSWENGCKVVAIALNHISIDRSKIEGPTSPSFEVVSLISSMMESTNNHLDGYRVGRAALQTSRDLIQTSSVSETVNSKIKSTIDKAFSDSDTTPSYEKSSDILETALRDIRFQIIGRAW